MRQVQHRRVSPAASRSTFASILTGLTITIASLCSQAGNLPDIPLPDDGFAAMAQNAVPAEDARVTVMADASSTPDMIRELVKPLYPEQARRDRVEGYVVVQFDIAKNGTVSEVRVLEARPANYFETAAVDAVRQMQFSPNDNAADPVAIRGAVNMFVFSLNAPNTPVKPGYIYYRGRTYYASAADYVQADHALVR